VSYLIRADGEPDWLDLSIPTGMLHLRYPSTYPLDRLADPWEDQVDELFARIAASIYEVAPFQLGLIGEEASGTKSATQLTKEDCERGGLLVPRSLWQRLAPNRSARELSSDLLHVPPPDITFR
jgi:hypothetical protein